MQEDFVGLVDQDFESLQKLLRQKLKLKQINQLYNYIIKLYEKLPEVAELFWIN